MFILLGFIPACSEVISALTGFEFVDGFSDYHSQFGDGSGRDRSEQYLELDLPGKSGGAFDNVALSVGPYEPGSTTKIHG